MVFGYSIFRKKADSDSVDLVKEADLTELKNKVLAWLASWIHPDCKTAPVAVLPSTVMQLSSSFKYKDHPKGERGINSSHPFSIWPLY